MSGFLTVLLLGQPEVAHPWHWIVSNEQIMIAAAPAATLEDGQGTKTVRLISYHRRPLADGADILHWRIDHNCSDPAGRVEVTHRRTIDTPPVEGGWLATDGAMPSLLGSAVRTLCRVRHASPRDDYSIAADEGVASPGALAQAARAVWHREGAAGDWRTVGEFQHAYGLVARDMNVSWQLGSRQAHRYAVAGVYEEGGRDVVRTHVTTVLVDCSKNAATLVDSYGLDEDGRREPGASVASSWFNLDQDKPDEDQGGAGAELSRMAWSDHCRKQPLPVGASFADARRFNDHAERVLAPGIEKP